MKTKAVIMGGGTGTFPVVRALQRLHCDVASIIAVSDSGGSTGRIRDEFGFQPVGDLRQALAALAESDGEEWIRKILLYRFKKGAGLQGHNLGNLILTALQDMTGNTTNALEIAEKIFRLDGRVIPVTNQNVQLAIDYADGTTTVGEATLDSATTAHKIDKIRLVPTAQINPLAADAIKDADIIIIGPGDYYASLMATLIADGTVEAFKHTSAKIVYIVNLMTRLTQTHDMTGRQHLMGIEAAIGRKIDQVIFNSGTVQPEILKLYAQEEEYPVVDDFGTDSRLIRADMMSDQVVTAEAFDTAHRSLLRHDTMKLEKIIHPLLQQDA